MSMHIEEPWKKFRDASGCGLSSINGDLIAEGLAEVDADRIVVCVNSLAGVPNELLQTIRQADLLAEVTAQRDELLNYIFKCLQEANYCVGNEEGLSIQLCKIRSIAAEAIAKCEVKNEKSPTL